MQLTKPAEVSVKVIQPHMALYFPVEKHEIFKCTVVHASATDLEKSIPYSLPVRGASLPAQDHGAQIDAAIATRDRRQEADTLFLVVPKQINSILAIKRDVFVARRLSRRFRVAALYSADPMIYRLRQIFPWKSEMCTFKTKGA